jgi:hypothetical protein
VQYQSDPNLPRLIGYALIAPRIKVMYVPTPKVAYSSLKLLIAQIEGSYNEAATREIITPNISQEQTIHNYRVHGLKRMRELSPEKQWEVIQSPDWLRIAALRDPLKRTYSSWENRVFLRAPGTPQQILDVCSDVLIDGRVDVAATFAKFARAISADRDAFALVDDHFRPQFNVVEQTFCCNVLTVASVSHLTRCTPKRSPTSLSGPSMKILNGSTLLDIVTPTPIRHLSWTHCSKHFFPISATRPIG